APSLLRGQAISLSESASALRDQGKFAEARAALEQAITLINGLLAKSPDEANLQRDRGIILQKIGDLELVSGNKEGALAFYKQNREIFETLAQGQPNGVLNQADVASSLAKLADGLLAMGRIDEALEYYKKARQSLRS